MASKVDIANLALSHLGDSADIAALDEGTAAAAHCNRFFDLCRDSLLELHNWNFATVRSTPAQLEDWDSDAWPFAYAAPAECLRILAAYATGHTSDQVDSLQFEVEASEEGDRIIVAKTEIGTIRWTRRVVDPTKYSALFVQGLARMLASAVAGPLIKGDAGRKAAADQLAFFAQWFAQATGSDSRQALRTVERVAPWITARGSIAGVLEDDPWMGVNG